MAESFKKNLSVDKRIVPLLSRSTYVNFPTAIRELISNACDADATTVKIVVDLKKKQLVVRDDGCGMTTDEFDFFLTIAGQSRHKSTTTPKFGRTRIGQFGIGFLAAFPYCKTMQITSTAENSDEIFTADIPAEQYFSYAQGYKDVTEIQVTGNTRKDSALRGEHFTEIKLLEVTPLVERYFSKKADGESLPKKRGPRPQLSIQDWEPFRRLKWELEEDLPVSPSEDSVLKNIFPEVNPVPLVVTLNDEKLVRNDTGSEILAEGAEVVGTTKFRYAITTSWKPIHPQEARWLKIRVNNVGVGPRYDFDVAAARQYSRIGWLTGEVHILKGMEAAIQLDRNGFIWDQTWEDICKRIRKLLSEKLNYLEEIDTARRDVDHRLRGTKRARVAPTRDVINKSVEALKKHGFEIVPRARAQRRRSSVEAHDPIEIDVSAKKVYLDTTAQSQEETITFGRAKFTLEYLPWTPEGVFPACRMGDNSVVQVNTQYPLFKSKRYGDLFKKLHIALLFAYLKSNSTKEMYQAAITGIFKEFNSY